MRGWSIKLGASLPLLCSACLANTGGNLLEVQGAIFPDQSCTYAATNAPAPPGFFDPLVDPTAPGFHLALVLRNNLQARADNQALMDQVVNVRNRVNDLQIIGFEGCWFMPEASQMRYGAFNNGMVVDCKKLPSQSGAIPANGQVNEGGQTTTLAFVDILTPEHLGQIFGAGFDAQAIPPLGLQAGDQDFDGNPRATYSLAAEDPGATSRSAAWGDNYPAQTQAPVLVQLRAVAQAQGGGIIKSNWFTYPVTLCPGCITSACGPLVQTTCADGSVKMTGYVPSYTGSTICLPAQRVTPPDCTTNKVGCLAGS